MRKLPIVGMAAMLSVASTACFADDGNFFVNGDVGQAHYRIASSTTYDSFNGPGRNSVDKKDTAGALRFGYRWHGVVDYGVEAGYVDLGQAQVKSYSYNNQTSDIKTRGWLLGGNLKYNINDAWYVSARGGWFRSRNEDKVKVSQGECSVICPLRPSGEYRVSSTGTGEYLGVGAGYNFSPNFSLGLSYDNYHGHPDGYDAYGNKQGANIALYSVSAEYRF